MKPSVLVDVDGVLARYNGWKGIEHIGDPIPGAVDFTKRLAEFAQVIIYTTRAKEFPGQVPAPGGAVDADRRPVPELVAILKAWLDKHGFAYDEIYSGQGKPFGAAIIDDRGVRCTPQEDGQYAFEYALFRTCELCRSVGPDALSQALQESEKKAC